MSECPNIHEPRGCWRVRCQLGKKCVEPKQITNEQREAIVRNAVAERDAALSSAPRNQVVYLVATGETHEGQETYTRHEVCPPLCDAETLYLHPSQPEPTSKGEEMSPEFTDTSRAALAWVLWHHQGASSEVGQAMRFALGIGRTDRMTEHQVAEAKRWAELSAPLVEASQQRALSDEAKDAARYRYLRAMWPMTILEDLMKKSVGRHPSIELDAAIDKASSGSEGGGE